MKKANAETFAGSMYASVATEMRRLNLGATYDRFSHYYILPIPPGFDSILDLQKPGTDDGLSVFLQEIHKQNRMVGFRRRGLLGFGDTAVPLLRETLLAVKVATLKFGW
jgi:hypothetical protein